LLLICKEKRHDRTEATFLAASACHHRPRSRRTGSRPFRSHPGIRRRARRSAGAETAGRAWHLGRACAEALAYWFASRPPEDHDLLEALQERSENFGGPQDPRLAG